MLLRRFKHKDCNKKYSVRKTETSNLWNHLERDYRKLQGELLSEQLQKKKKVYNIPRKKYQLLRCPRILFDFQLIQRFLKKE